jgi:hypothetical protein
MHHAVSLREWPVGERVWFFRDLLAPPFHGGAIRVVLAALRAALVHIESDRRAALCAPVAPARKDAGFPLHADLFLTTRLWLIFDEVPEDGSGASLFLSRGAFVGVLRSVEAMPRDRVREVETLLTGQLARDSFDKLYGLLHGARHSWHQELRESLRRQADAILMKPGEGYLLDDRCWLHGRTASSGTVSSRRFHRLSFGMRS